MQFSEAPSLSLPFANHRRTHGTLKSAYETVMAEREVNFDTSTSSKGIVDSTLFDTYMTRSYGLRRPFTSPHHVGVCNRGNQ